MMLIMNIRDITTGNNGPLIYSSVPVAQNSTQFIIPVNKLERGHRYRWCLSSVDEGDIPNAPVGNAISKTYDLLETLSAEDKKNPLYDNISLVMNQTTTNAYITNVDKAHLIIKWGFNKALVIIHKF